MKRYTITVNGTPYDVTVDEAGNTGKPAVVPVAAAPAAVPVSAPAVPAASGATKIESPMPGTILDVKVNVGDSVTNGQVVCILEAMKMENDIVAPADGTIASISVKKGDTVEAGSVLISMN